MRAAEDQRLAGLDAHAVEEEFSAQRGEHGFDDVVLAGGDAAGEQQKVGGESLFDEGAGMIGLITRYGEDAGGRLRRAPPAPPASTRWSYESGTARGVSPTATISSPVARMAATGRAYTAACSRPTAASMATSV